MQSRDYNLNGSICSIVGRSTRRCNLVKLIGNWATEQTPELRSSVWMLEDPPAIEWFKTTKSKMSQSLNAALCLNVYRFSFAIQVNGCNQPSSSDKHRLIWIICSFFSTSANSCFDKVLGYYLSIHEIATNWSRFSVEGIHNNNKNRKTPS